MSTGEVVKFMHHVLLPSKTVLVVPYRKMLQTTCKYYILSFLQIFLAAFFTVVACKKVVTTSKKYFLSVVLPVNLISSSFIYTLTKIFLLIKANCFKEIFSDIAKINLSLKYLNSFFPPHYNPFELKASEAVWLFVFIYVMLTHIFFHIVIHPYQFLRWTALTYDFNLSMLHFMLTVLKCFVTAINIQLEFIKKVVYARQKVHTLEECVRIYVKICNTCLKVEKIFGLPLFFISSFYYIILIVNTHYILMKIAPENDVDLRLLENRRNMGWITMCIIDIVFCTISCQSLNTNSEDLNVAIYEVLLKDESRELWKSKKLLSCVYINRRIGLTALGFFDVDYTMLQSMLSSCTTYLVILSQYDSASKIKVFLGNVHPKTTTVSYNSTV